MVYAKYNYSDPSVCYSQAHYLIYHASPHDMSKIAAITNILLKVILNLQMQNQK